jgi:hypothetical protein
MLTMTTTDFRGGSGLCLLGIAILIAGCGTKGKESIRGTGTVTGTVTLNDKPVTNGRVILFDEKDSDTAAATIGTDGSFQLKYGTGFSIPCGDYRAVVVQGAQAGDSIPTPEELMKNPDKYKPKPSEIPEKYSDPKTSGLIAVVQKGSNTLDLKLKK